MNYTIADIAETGTTEIHDSLSFRPTFSATGTTGRTTAYSEIESDGVVEWAIRNERYKLISNATGGRELYDLSLDPFESTELISAGLDAEGAIAMTELEALVEQLKN